MSSSQSESTEYRLDGLKWLVVAALVAVIIAGNWIYSDHSLLYRVVAALAVAAMALAVAFQTRKGASAWNLIKGARGEMRRVTWPTRPETNQTTLMVVIVVFLMALILWLLDIFFGWLASFILA